MFEDLHRKVSAHMDAEPNCIACNLKRTLISVSPTANRHEMQCFECPKCHTILTLVVEREPPRVPGLASA
jgi:hypothetical protein